ncbi:hypothetical protein FGIG_09231 [Fasciola gigantica]|uniref:PH domain-containing protein n=1 Tax=Fasciola gigantica TaxID=46835 RepID=A0A504YZQ3_FASGI|nr:hypothetical protein FGIG_09231 [Fasciola gigantica]
MDWISHYRKITENAVFKHICLDPSDQSVTDASNFLSLSTVAAGYTKRPHVFRILNSNTGASYLFQAPNEEVMQRWIDRLVLWCQPRGTHLPRPKSTMTIALSRPLEEYDGPPELLDSTEQRKRVAEIALDRSPGESPAPVAHSTGVWGLKSFAPKLVLRWLKLKQSPHSKEPKPGIIQSSMTQVIVSGTRPTSASTSRSTELRKFGSASLKFSLISRSQTLPSRFGFSSGSGIGISEGSSFLCPGRPKSSKKSPAAIENSEMEEYDAEPSFTLMPQEDVNGEAVLLESDDQIIDDEESKIH